MISFGEALVVISAAGFLLGKREITAGARFFGLGIGRVVGMLQGLRIKYEEKSRGTQLYKLHRTVKRGLDDMSTIGNDLATISSGNITNTPPPLPQTGMPRKILSSASANTHNKINTGLSPGI